MPDYSNDTYEQTQARLKKYGTEIGSFNQSTFRTKLASTVIEVIPTVSGDKSLAGGYCNGVLLDWVRRVLLSQAKQNQAFLTFHSDALKEGKNTVRRTHKELQGSASQTVQRMGQAWWHSGDMNWVGEEGKPTSIRPEEWKRTVSAIDEEFDKQRAGAKRESSKKHFGRLQLEASRKTTYQSAGFWMGALFNAFRSGHCTCAGFSAEGRGAHSVAIWQRRNVKDANDSFYFFDPNYGVYSFNEDNLQMALQYCFRRDAKNTPKYVNSTTATDQMMSYMTFGPPNLIG